MARNTSISLGEHFTDFIDARVESGRYSSASEVVRAGLRLLESHEEEIRAVQQAIADGEASGDPYPFDGEAFLARMKSKKHGR